MQRILVVGAAGWHNAGDDIIALRLAEWAADQGARVRFLGGPDIASVGRGTPLGGSFRSRIRTLWEIARANVVLIGGGGLLDDRIPAFYRPFTRVAKFARAARKRHGFIGVGVGPVRSEDARAAYREAGTNASFVWVRDDQSRQRLIDVGVPAENVQVRGDVVAWQRASPAVSVEYDIAVNLRGWGHIEGDTDETAPVVQAVAQYLAGRAGARVALVSMSKLGHEDDAKAMAALRPFAERVVDSADPREVEAVIARSGVVLSMRLHGCLVAASNSVPTIGIAYDPKITQQGAAVGFATLTIAEASDAAQIERAIAAATVAPPDYRLLPEPKLP